MAASPKSYTTVLDEVTQAFKFNQRNTKKALFLILKHLGGHSDPWMKSHELLQAINTTIAMKEHQEQEQQAAVPAPDGYETADSDDGVDWGSYEEASYLEFFMNVAGVQLWSVAFDPSDQLMDLVDYIQERSESWDKVPRITYAGKPLENMSATLGELGIYSHSTLDVRLVESIEVMAGGGKRGRDAGGVDKQLVMNQMQEAYNVSLLKLQSKVAFDRDLEQAIERVRTFHAVLNVTPRETVKRAMAQFTADDVMELNEALAANRGPRKAAKAVDKYCFQLVHQVIAEKKLAMLYLEETTMHVSNMCIHAAYYDNKNCSMNWGLMSADLLGVVHADGVAQGQRQQAGAQPHGLQ